MNNLYQKKNEDYSVIIIFIILNLFSINNYIETNFFYKPIIFYFFIYLTVFIISNYFIKHCQVIDYDKRIIAILKLFWLHSVIIIIFSIDSANNYFEYKFIFIGYVPYLFTTLCIFLISDIEKLIYFSKKYFNVYLPISIFLLILFYNSSSEFFTRGNSFLYFFIIFYPFVKSKKIKLLLIFSTIASFVIEPGWRTNILRISLIWMFVILYNFKFINSKNFLFFFKIIILIPIFYFLITYILKINLIDIFTNNADENPFFADTRSFMFSLTLEAIMENNLKLIFGYGTNASLFIESFNDYSSFDRFGEVGRLNQESAFITKLYKAGILGVLIDLSLFIVAGLTSIKYSNNDFSKFIGLLCALNYLVYFVEIPIGININYFFIYMIIGLATFNSLRAKTTIEIKKSFEK